MAPTSLLGDEAVWERVEKEGTFLMGSCVEASEAAFWAMTSSLRQSAILGDCDPGFRVCDLPLAVWPRESYQPLSLEYHT